MCQATALFTGERQDTPGIAGVALAVRRRLCNHPLSARRW